MASIIVVCHRRRQHGAPAPGAARRGEFFRAVIDRNLTTAFLAFPGSGAFDAAGAAALSLSRRSAPACPPLSSRLIVWGKAGLEALVTGAAKECARLKIRVNAVRPGMTRAAGVTQHVRPADHARAGAGTDPPGRPGRSGRDRRSRALSGRQRLGDGAELCRRRRFGTGAQPRCRQCGYRTFSVGDWPAPWSDLL